MHFLYDYLIIVTKKRNHKSPYAKSTFFAATAKFSVGSSLKGDIKNLVLQQGFVEN